MALFGTTARLKSPDKAETHRIHQLLIPQKASAHEEARLSAPNIFLCEVSDVTYAGGVGWQQDAKAVAEAEQKVKEADKKVKDAQEKLDEAKAEEKKLKNDADSFFADWGVGLSVTTKLGKRGEAIEEAQLVDGKVRVTSERDVVPRLMLERHW